MKQQKQKQEIEEAIDCLQEFLECDLWSQFKDVKINGNVYTREDKFKTESELWEYLNVHFNILKHEIRRLIFDIPQEKKDNSEGSNTDYLDTLKAMEEVNKHEYKSKCPDNHPVGSYVYLHDVIGLFKNRKQTKTKVIQRRNIIEHLNKLRRYEVR